MFLNVHIAWGIYHFYSKMLQKQKQKKHTLTLEMELGSVSVHRKQESGFYKHNNYLLKYEEKFSSPQRDTPKDRD